MTDQTEFERDLADRLRARADRTRVDLDHDRIVGNRPARRPAAGRPAWGVALSFAAVIALVVTGLVLLVRTGDDTPAPADTFAPVVTTPATTVPPPPDYGVLDDTDGPTIEDHWHAAYGIFLCGQWFQLTGNLEEAGAPGNTEYLQTGIHSHDDGVIHIHPFADAGAGDNARLGIFLMNYGVAIGDRFVGGTDRQPMWGEMPCDISLKPISVVVWPDALDPVDPIVVTSGLFDLPLRDGAAITITDTLEGVTPPPWASALPDLAAVDAGQSAPGELLQPGSAPELVGTVPLAGPIVDVAECGQPVTGPASGLGIETVRIDVASDGSSFDITLRNTTPDPVPVGVAPFLATLDAAGAVASRPSQVGVWQTQMVPPGEALTIPVGEVVAGSGVVGTVPCPGTGMATGAHDFVAVLDVGGAIVASDPVVLTVTG